MCLSEFCNILNCLRKFKCDVIEWCINVLHEV